MKKREEDKQIIFESLKLALMQLLKTKAFDKISITSLVTKAGIARSTFYKYFDDKTDLIRFLIQQEMLEFDQRYKPKTIKERFQEKYINEVFQYLLKDKKEVISIYQAGLSHLYLEEMNKHLLNIYPYHLTEKEEINLYGLAGAQYNIIFNLFAKKYKDMQDKNH